MKQSTTTNYYYYYYYYYCGFLNMPVVMGIFAMAWFCTGVSAVWAVDAPVVFFGVCWADFILSRYVACGHDADLEWLCFDSFFDFDRNLALEPEDPIHI